MEIAQSPQITRKMQKEAWMGQITVSTDGWLKSVVHCGKNIVLTLHYRLPDPEKKLSVTHGQ